MQLIKVRPDDMPTQSGVALSCLTGMPAAGSELGRPLDAQPARRGAGLVRDFGFGTQPPRPRHPPWSWAPHLISCMRSAAGGASAACGAWHDPLRMLAGALDW